MATRAASAPGLTRRALGGALLGVVAMAGPWGPWGTVAPGREEAKEVTGAAAHRTAPRAPSGAEPSAQPSAPPGAQPSSEPHPGAPAPPSPEPRAAELWTTPVVGYPISAPYGIPGDWQAGHHTGVDFAVPEGTPVRSVGPGTVDSAGYSGDYGNAVTVRMDDGYYALYAHLSRVSVRAGERVAAGTHLGDSGNTGRSSGPHLHFEVRTSPSYGTDVDPLAYLATRGVRVS